MTKLIYIIIFLFSLQGFAQRDTLIGRVKVSGSNAPDVFIINKNTGKEVKSGVAGLFEIPARNGDKLVVYSEHTIVREFFIGKESFAHMPYELEVDAKPYQLDEVVIDNKVNSKSLGLVPEGQKQYTVAERRLKTAGEFKPSLLFFLGGGVAFPLDPIINAISGRTKMLKKELATERKEMGMESIGNVYTAEEMTTELGIPAEKVQAFIFFAVEDPELMRAIKNKNEARAKLELAVLAGRYLDMQEGAGEDSQPQPQLSEGQQPTTGNPQPTTQNQSTHEN
jgi:hypothetical protein